MKETKVISTRATHLHKTTKKKAFLKTVKKVNRPRKPDQPGRDRKNPRAQPSASLMEELRWNRVLIQMGAFEGQKYRFNCTVKLH